MTEPTAAGVVERVDDHQQCLDHLAPLHAHLADEQRLKRRIDLKELVEKDHGRRIDILDQFGETGLDEHPLVAGDGHVDLEQTISHLLICTIPDGRFANR
ncbi:MAG: hypothetical protein U0521_12910 [Anaerolineae bacterium]